MTEPIEHRLRAAAPPVIAPLAAAAAVIAVIAVASQPGPGPAQSSRATPALAAPRQLQTPLVPFTGFGWLPVGRQPGRERDDQLLLSRGRSPVQLMTYQQPAAGARVVVWPAAGGLGVGETVRI